MATADFLDTNIISIDIDHGKGDLPKRKFAELDIGMEIFEPAAPLLPIRPILKKIKVMDESLSVAKKRVAFHGVRMLEEERKPAIREPTVRPSSLPWIAQKADDAESLAALCREVENYSLTEDNHVKLVGTTKKFGSKPGGTRLQRTSKRL